ncbi:MAG TPA: hypothetical protein VGP82_16665, partial [Ktedonobacterales bacterium]|nr:hypothetical protein [Ktedonobacterales bacterium]
VVFFVATLAVSVMVVRYRRACGEQRQQIKWFALGGAAMILRVVASIVINDRTLHQTVYALGMILLPLGAGIGILKYRLYDIDLIINRASVYGSLGVLLALVYVFGVFGSQTAVGLVTHRSQGASPLVFVVTALVLAALFQPVRQRIQTAIDRRFYRLKYDTARTSASFATTPRNEVDVQELSGSLLGVVEVTMQPAQVTLWISPQVEVKA